MEEPILSRIDRLDNMLRQLEEIRGYNRSPKSSCASTATSVSDGHVSSLDFSPRSLEKHCRPIENVMMQTQLKGSLIERLNQVEERMLKLQEELEAERKREEEEKELEAERKREEEEKKHNSPKRKGLKQLVRQCVKARGKDDHK